MRVRIGAFATLLPLALAGAGNAFAAEDSAAPDAAAARCSKATLHGTYLFANDGVVLRGNDRIQLANAGMDVYDGNGHVREVFTLSVNGKITRFSRVTGTYTVRSDCTGTARYSDGTRYDQFVAPDGSQVVFVQTNPGAVVAASDSLFECGSACGSHLTVASPKGAHDRRGWERRTGCGPRRTGRGTSRA